MGIETDAGSSQPSGLRRISYRKPSLSGQRGMTMLAATDTLVAIVQTLAPGARQGLHAHGAYDGFYFVLSGRARFYGRNNELFAEVGPNEGVFVPRNTPYAFEAAEGEVQMLAIDAIDKTIEDTFVSHEDGSDRLTFESFAPDGALLDLQELTMDAASG
jgi:mannose-6-phosphate isomerase-like protein (cupin superfamily)